MQVELTKYLETFTHLRKGVTKFGPAPHKLILLLSVIKGIEDGAIQENKIFITDKLINDFTNLS